jgi:hypothetical protein
VAWCSVNQSPCVPSFASVATDATTDRREPRQQIVRRVSARPTRRRHRVITSAIRCRGCRRSGLCRRPALDEPLSPRAVTVRGQPTLMPGMRWGAVSSSVGSGPRLDHRGVALSRLGGSGTQITLPSSMENSMACTRARRRSRCSSRAASHRRATPARGRASRPGSWRRGSRRTCPAPRRAGLVGSVSGEQHPTLRHCVACVRRTGSTRRGVRGARCPAARPTARAAPTRRSASKVVERSSCSSRMNSQRRRPGPPDTRVVGRPGSQICTLTRVEDAVVAEHHVGDEPVVEVAQLDDRDAEQPPHGAALAPSATHDVPGIRDLIAGVGQWRTPHRRAARVSVDGRSRAGCRRSRGPVARRSSSASSSAENIDDSPATPTTGRRRVRSGGASCHRRCATRRRPLLR